jgi:N utilization substance protein B
LEEIRAPASRRKARIAALQVLFEFDVAKHDPVRALENRQMEASLSPAAEAYARKLIDGVLQSRTEIDKLISTYAPAWPISQMAMLDRNILRVAIFEILIGRDAPPRVAINEAVELGKVFGADSSPRFVNGVLGSLMEDTEAKSKP